MMFPFWTLWEGIQFLLFWYSYFVMQSIFSWRRRSVLELLFFGILQNMGGFNSFCCYFARGQNHYFLTQQSLTFEIVATIGFYFSSEFLCPFLRFSFFFWIFFFIEFWTTVCYHRYHTSLFVLHLMQSFYSMHQVWEGVRIVL